MTTHLFDRPSPPPLEALGRALLGWYAQHKRALPWRTSPSAYGIWISEVMAQQTRMDTVVPRWHQFLQRFGSIATLAAAAEHEVCEAWAGLGYYSRARNLHRAACVVMQEHGGRLPQTAESLRTLPGIGPYIAGAIASTAFGEVTPVVDGNVVRVLSRLHLLTDPANTAPGQAAYWRHATDLQAAAAPLCAPGDLNQALMELGALVCLPRQPLCDACPWQPSCAARLRGVHTQLPVKAPKKAPVALEMTYALHETPRGLLLTRRPLQGLWAGLWEPPSAAGPGGADQLRARGFSLDRHLGQVDHVLTHRLVRAQVYLCGPNAAPRARAGEVRKRRRDPLSAPLSRLAHKVIALAQATVPPGRRAARLSKCSKAGTSGPYAHPLP